MPDIPGLTVIDCKDKPEWLKERDNFVVTGSGGNEMISRPLTFYARKKGLLPPIEQTERMRWGLRFQRAIGFGFGEDTGREVEEAPPYSIFVCPDAPFIGATLDFFEKDPEKGEGILETKNVSAEWIEEIPIAYQIQVQIQLACVPIKKYGTVAGVQAGNKLQWADIDRHAEFMKRFISKAEEMQWRLSTNNPPPVDDDGSEDTAKALSALYPSDRGTQIALPPEALEWTREVEALKAQSKVMEEEIRARENALKAAIGDATMGVLADGSGWSWKSQRRVDPPRLEERVTEFRVLRRLKGK